ncbi:unnamed protein product, partial [Rotaria sordida]
ITITKPKRFRSDTNLLNTSEISSSSTTPTPPSHHFHYLTMMNYQH